MCTEYNTNMTITQLTKAIENNIHTKSQYDFGLWVEQQLDSLPTYTLDMLATRVINFPCLVMETSMSGGYFSHRSRTILTLHKFTPSKTQAIVSNYNNHSNQYKITRKSSGTFSIIPEDLVWLIGLNDHKRIVEFALEKNLNIPASVRVEYPELFIDIPQWVKEDHNKQFTKLLNGKGYWKYDRLLPTNLESMIEEKIKYVGKLQFEMESASLRSPNSRGDYEKLISDNMRTIELYRWLIPHISEGGVFYDS
jgi:hypothetical protein